jgi:acetyl esterase/lipase
MNVLPCHQLRPDHHGMGVEVVREVVYARPGGRHLVLDLYLPPAATGLHAAIIWLHGGGWRTGDRSLAPDLRRFYAECGYVMASIDYRLSGEAIFPAAVEDVKSAVRWLKSVAEKYAVDPTRIALWGSSAGGHLAALAATSGPGCFEGGDFEHRDQDSGVAAVIDGYGPIDFLQMDAHRDPEGKGSDDPESIQLPPGTLSVAPDSMEAAFLGAPILTCPDRVRAANPIHYMRSGLPPFLILHGTSDPVVPLHQSVILYDALAAAGNEVCLAIIKGLGHGFLARKNIEGTNWDAELRTARSGVSEVRAIRIRLFDFIGEWLDTHLAGVNS